MEAILEARLPKAEMRLDISLSAFVFWVAIRAAVVDAVIAARRAKRAALVVDELPRAVCAEAVRAKEREAIVKTETAMILNVYFIVLIIIFNY